jgi:hypothetical protein
MGFLTEKKDTIMVKIHSRYKEINGKANYKKDSYPLDEEVIKVSCQATPTTSTNLI